MKPSVKRTSNPTRVGASFFIGSALFLATAANAGDSWINNSAADGVNAIDEEGGFIK